MVIAKTSSEVNVEAEVRFIRRKDIGNTQHLFFVCLFQCGLEL